MASDNRTLWMAGIDRHFMRKDFIMMAFRKGLQLPVDVVTHVEFPANRNGK